MVRYFDLSMLTINMRVFKTILLSSALFSCALCKPLENLTTEAPSASALQPTTLSTGDVFDQRQNGTENYRIHVDGLVFVIAPVETLLLAASEATPSLPGQNEISKPQEKPKPLPEGVKLLSAPKSAHRSGFRLSQLLAPFLRRIRQE